jgi:ribonuclease HII
MLSDFFLAKYLEAGCDEAGRGCLAGPVTAACVVLPHKVNLPLLNDSKLLSEKSKSLLVPQIKSLAIDYAVIHINENIIDEVNILEASLKAMLECILKLETKPIHIILDGNQPLISNKSFLNKHGKVFTTAEIEYLKSIPSTSIIKGDSKYKSIAAASVLAKTYRDDFMDIIHEEYPMYNWKQNKGYPTKEHREAIKKFGITKYHRLSFKLLPDK